MKYRIAILPAVFASAFAASVSAVAQSPIFPDLIFEPSEMLDNEVDTTTIPGTVLFRFSSSLPNIGLGEYRVEGTSANCGDGLQPVEQIIFSDMGGEFMRVDAGDFLWNPCTSRMENSSWVAYRFREVLPGDGVGAIVASGGKTAVIMTSSAVYDNSLPNFPPSGFLASGNTHGISVGYTDLYPKFLPFQWIDVTDVPSGEYWLEVEVDVGDHIMESDETNNVTRIKVNYTAPDSDGDGLSDAFEMANGLLKGESDSDGDGLNDYDEVAYDGDPNNYNPFKPFANPGGTDTNGRRGDSDFDGFLDSVEISVGTDPLLQGDVPTGLPVSSALPLAGLGLMLAGLAFRAQRRR